jgi:hypothetical protein
MIIHHQELQQQRRLDMAVIGRYQRCVGQEGTFFLDRVTGQRLFQGYENNAPPDMPVQAWQVFAKAGLDIYEEVPVDRCIMKPSAAELAQHLMRIALEAERVEEFKRGSELLVEVDILTYLGVSGSALSTREEFAAFERTQLVPALEAKGFSMIAFFDPDRVAINVVRGIRAVRDGLGHVFYYGAYTD